MKNYQSDLPWSWHSIFNSFSKLDEAKKKELIDGAREVKTRDEMRSYVENMRMF